MKSPGSKKLLFVSTGASNAEGASEVLWQKTAESLLQRGHDVGIAGRDTEISRRAYTKPALEGARVFCFSDHWETTWEKVAGRLGLLENFSALRENWDLVVINQGYAFSGLPWAEACIRRGLPFVTTWHSVSSDTWPEDPLASAANEAYSKARKNYFISLENKRLLESRLAHSIAKAELVRNPVPVQGTPLLPWPENNETFRLASVGRLRPLEKGQDLILDVLASKKWKDRPLEVHFYGEGPCRKILERRQEQLGLRQKTFFHGHTAAIVEVWKTHHGLLLPSRTEGFSLALAEAMWCGRFAIANAVGENPHVIKHAENGILMENATPRSLDAALEAAWQARESWEQWGKNARAAILKIFEKDPVDSFRDHLLSAAG